MGFAVVFGAGVDVDVAVVVLQDGNSGEVSFLGRVKFALDLELFGLNLLSHVSCDPFDRVGKWLGRPSGRRNVSRACASVKLNVWHEMYAAQYLLRTKTGPDVPTRFELGF